METEYDYNFPKGKDSIPRVFIALVLIVLILITGAILRKLGIF